MLKAKADQNQADADWTVETALFAAAPLATLAS